MSRSSAATPHLTLDFALPAALTVVAACTDHGDMVLDGSGNDKYMDFRPPVENGS